MSDPIEIGKRYRDLERADDFVSYDCLAGGNSNIGEQGSEGEAGFRSNRGSVAGGRRSEAEKELSRVREELERIRAEQKDLKNKAYEEGLASGQEEGRRKGREEYAEKIDSITLLINELGEIPKKLVNEYEAEILELIKVMAERLVQQEISQDKPVIREILNSALEYIVESTTVSVKMNRADIERLNSSSEQGELLFGKRRVKLVEDNSISVGGCLVETSSGEVDATLENRRDVLFAAVDKALADDKEKTRMP
ncbi:MAG: FliH/SctL family protein [Thermodesulfobacteriota bacterium]